MTREIKKVVLLGANGTMGFGSGTLFTGADCEVHFLARTKAKAEEGLIAAKKLVRSNTVGNKVTLGSYDKDLEKSVANADLIFEAVAEDFQIKSEFYEKIDQCRRPDSIVATVSSGLSITKLAEPRSKSFQKHFLGLHYFNPPHVITGTEIILGKETDPTLIDFLIDWCAKNQQRVMVKTFDRPGFAGNRVGFKVLNEVAQLAEKYGPAYMDAIIGPYTGRAMAPLATIDLVGWDVHRAIVDNVIDNVSSETDEAFATYHMPEYMRDLLADGTLGNKSGKGFFKRVEKEKFVLDIATGDYVPVSSVSVPKPAFIKEMKFLHNVGKYKEAMKIFAEAEGPEALIAQKVIGGYISYSFHRVGEVTEDITAIDMIMGMGFNWAPPSVLVDTIGLKETVAMMEKAKVLVPLALSKALSKNSKKPFFNHPQVNIGKFFVAK
ncbi:MAG: 3-hydroxyacyl-CoA dehydrogenase family protein [SAR324 cluster bacterium]|nr:3-hydroxyacyl-CoA dehydrogenase family protein [SAR324 cluster bacterium]